LYSTSNVKKKQKSVFPALQHVRIVQTMMSVISIAIGGALGAVGRHFVNVGAAQAFGLHFPYGTLTVNVLGSFIMGALIAAFAHGLEMPQHMKSLLTVGFLGAFTTFSTFSLDAVSLYERGAMMASALYILASVTLSIAALFAGLYLVRQVMA
jgi:CrcB protein